MAAACGRPRASIVFCASVLLIADNFIQPALIGGTTRLPFLLALIGILGGLTSFGLVGLFLGPVMLGHTQVQTTARYAHLAADPIRDAADQVASNIAASLNHAPARQEPTSVRR